MTDQEKMRKLFEAALRAPEEPAPSAPKPFLAPAVFQPAPPSPSAQVEPQETPAVATSANAGLDAATSAELAALLDEKHRRKQRKRRADALVTLAILLGLSLGGFTWFIQSPQRMQAFHETMRDFHSIGDMGSILAKYREALAKVSVRSKQIDDSTRALGVKNTNPQDQKDPYLDAEMKQMMGSDAPTVGQRNQHIQQKFGHFQN